VIKDISSGDLMSVKCGNLKLMNSEGIFKDNNGKAESKYEQL
jgi:hypothetical protein